MTQRVFDMENDKDIKDLFDILPDWVKKISPIENIARGMKLHGTGERDYYALALNINWNGRTYVDRPVDESKWIGCLCRFWNDYRNGYFLGVLDRIVPGDDCHYKTKSYYGQDEFENCRPVMRNEIKFAEDEEK